MSSDIVNAYRAKMVVGKIYKDITFRFKELNNNGVLLTVILKEIQSEQNIIGIIKYKNIKYCFVIPFNKKEFLVNIPSKYIKT
jgi:hypothetical protein